ncbi:MAG: MnhB domain-containing protein, partial [Clostridiaceae bacterium]
NGHLSPGGGFPAGAILSTAVLLGFLSKTKVPSQNTFKYIEAISGILIFSMGIIAFMINGSFFYNFLEGGRIGNILSGGIIPIFYSLVAFKVASELSSVFYDFYKEGEGHELN